MRWDRVLIPVIRRSQTLVSAHGVSTLPWLPRTRLTGSVTKHHCYHSQCSQLQTFSLLNNISEFEPGVQVTYYANVRGYAKGKDRGKEKKKGDKGKKKLEVSDEVLGEVIKVENMRNQMQKAVDKLKDEYVKNLSLRSTTGSIESLAVSFENKDYELQELAQIVRKNPKTIVINMSVFPQAIPAALHAIHKSGMNLNPQQDGNTLFIPIPKVTKEHRENLAKNAKVLYIKCRDSIKEVQNKFLRTVKNNTSISEDLSHELQEQIVVVGDQYVSEGEKIYQAKHSELIGKD
ncbi:hypothetical protein C0J52_02022 [Blattella germanica]|nr:hypothetical protein C0J52_02022 [Blattella germanica]